MSHRATINVDFLSQMHRISCRLPVGQSGLVGLLNDNMTSMIEVEDAYFSRLQQPAKIVGHFDATHLLKMNLSLVLVNRREDLGPVGLARGGFSRVVNLPVLVTTPTFEVRGTLEMTGKFDPAELLVGGIGKFIILHNANALATQFPDTPFSGVAVLINRSMVEVIAPVSSRGKA